MKKHYINPETSIINVKLTLLQAASQLDQNKDDQNVNPDSNEKIDGGFGSRRHDVWEDDELDGKR